MICELAVSLVLLGCPDNTFLDEAVPHVVEYVEAPQPEPDVIEFDVEPANMTIDEYREEYGTNDVHNGGSGGDDHNVSTNDQVPQPNTGVPWDAIARCESGYGGEPNWSINTGNGFYGGLQFEKESWDWAGGQQYAEWPHHATREQQIAVAEQLLAIHPAGIGAWPACADKLGLR